MKNIIEKNIIFNFNSKNFYLKKTNNKNLNHIFLIKNQKIS